MMRNRQYLITAILISGSATFSILSAQQGMTVHSGAVMHTHEFSEMGIHIDVDLDGTFESSRQSTANRPLIYFLGDEFEIDASTGSLGPFPWTNLGGEFIFKSTSVQTLLGGASNLNDENSYFPNLTIDNSSNVYLKNYQAGVLNTLKFTSGKLILDQNDFVVGTRSSNGTIENYNQDRYVVTNGSHDQDASGFLITYLDNTISNWPIGSDETYYMPVRLEKKSGIGQQVKVRVWQGASTLGYGVPDITNESCGSTWDISPTGASSPTIEMTLGHPISLEGADYAIQRTNAYVTHYVGAAPNTDGGALSLSEWDLLTSGGVGSVCDITTGTSIATHVMHTRSNVSSFSPFSKAVTTDSSPLPVELLSFEAVAQNQDSRLEWETASEINNSGFEIEHSTDGSEFEYIGFVEGNGNSSTLLNYEFLHVAPGTGIHYYRLKQIDFDGQFEYSQVRSVQFLDDVTPAQLSAYPNPSNGLFTLEMNGSSGISHVSVYSLTGDLIYDSPSDNLLTTRVDLSLLARGTYMIIVNQDPSLSLTLVKN